MAIYATFFLCEPDRLASGFPGWKPPLPQPVERERIHPISRELYTIETCEPDWDDFDPDCLSLPEYQVVAIEGDCRDYLEQRLLPTVQSMPHWCGKGLTSDELGPLVAAALDAREISLTTPLYAHPLFAGCLNEFPDAFVATLRSADQPALQAIAQEWAVRMSTPEFTHSVSGERLYDDWKMEDALGLLAPIAKLVTEGTERHSLYLLNEW
ncbi:hypothetical protein [Blastopirellula marina]|uniref:Uncharacterized protein n=1 Tax=Blastopirellula marina TaxID=124 RepID=A0A2S8GMW9_9BACT|nr:hypothetical protein [Blastopirellula marina]PQO45783.1 hypothetical protein C5Y93_12730 [Blastopirellula marina]